jgi:uncharacterized protein YegL
MKKGLVEFVFILDRSGSMRGLESDTIGGFNALIEKQRETPGDVLVSLVLFDDQFEVVYHRRDIKAIPALSTKEYFVRGSTALVDAIGRGIRKIVNVYKALGDDNVPEKTVFVITTDGQENASKEFDSHTLKRLVQQQQEKYGWEFMFLGANIDAFATAQNMGFKETHTANVQYSKTGMRSQYDVLGRALFRYRNDDKNFADELLEIRGNEEAKDKKKK